MQGLYKWSGIIQRDSSVKLCDLQNILNVKIVLIITFHCMQQSQQSLQFFVLLYFESHQIICRYLICIVLDTLLSYYYSNSWYYVLHHDTSVADMRERCTMCGAGDTS